MSELNINDVITNLTNDVTAINEKLKTVGNQADKDALEVRIKSLITEEVSRKGTWVQPTVVGSDLLDETQKKSFDAWADDVYILSKMLGRHPKETSLWKKLEKSSMLSKAMDITTSGEGTDWVPTNFSATLREKIRVQGKIAPLFETIPMPTNVYKLPFEGADATAYYVGETIVDSGTAIPASTPGTTAPYLTARKLAVRVIASEELVEDSIIPILPYLRDKVVGAISKARELAILHGDRSSTYNTGVTDGRDARKAWNGLQYHALVCGVTAKTSGAGAALTSAMLGTLRSYMGKYAINPSECAVICGVKTYHSLVKDSALDQVSELGDKATLLSGQLASIWGIPVVVSEHIQEDLNVSGAYDNSTKTQSCAIIVHRPSFVIGDRRKVTIDSEKMIDTDQRKVVATYRGDFQILPDITTEPAVGLVYYCI